MSAEIDRELVGVFEGRKGAIGVVARASPGWYLDWLARREPGTLDLVILGDVDDPRAGDVLRAALDHPDWLHRHHAGESLARRRNRVSPHADGPS